MDPDEREWAVVSECWTLDDAGAADGYVAAYERFLDFHRRHDGFRGRTLLRGRADRTHFVNVRRFASVEAYEELVAMDGYGERIAEMGQFLDLSRPPPKEYLEVVVVDGPRVG